MEGTIPKGRRNRQLRAAASWQLTPPTAPSLSFRRAGIARNLAVNERAGVRLLEERAIAALLVTLWCFLIFDRLLSHLGGNENPFGSSHFKVRVIDWDPIRAEH